MNKYECMCTPAQVCESSQISPASKKCPKLPGLLEKTKQKQNKTLKNNRSGGERLKETDWLGK